MASTFSARPYFSPLRNYHAGQEVGDSTPTKCESDSSVLDGAKCGRQAGVVFTLITSKGENVIHVAQYTLVSSQDCTHPALRILGRTADAEW